jgi:hypothetical protein
MSVDRPFKYEQDSRPREGASVITADRKKLGKISEVSGSYFKVHAPMRHDYWLSVGYATESMPEEVRLEFEKKELDDHKLAEPGLEPEEDPTHNIVVDSVLLGEDELLQQRARMEAELAEQRKDLPIHQGGGESGSLGEPVESELARIHEELDGV